MSHYLFIDESGDHNLKSHNRSGKLFLLCGCVVKSEEIEKIDHLLDEFKVKHFGTKEVVLHYRDIRKREGIFNILLDKKKNDLFIEELKGIISTIDFKVIVSVIDKSSHINEYGKVADDPYELSLNFVVERYIFCCDRNMNESLVFVEKRGAKEDTKLTNRWVKIYQRGTGYIQSEEIQKKIKELKMHWKTDNINGLQIADISASSILRKFIHSDKDEEFFDILKPKIVMHRNAYIGKGVKVFPVNSGYTKTISSLLGEPTADWEPQSVS